MSDKEEPADPQAVADATRKFWRDIAREIVKNSPNVIEETAKQVIVIAGILEGLYFHAITFADLRGKVTDFWPMFAYLAPLIFWSFSLIAAGLVFFPKTYTLNINSSEAAKTLHENMVPRKYLFLILALVWLIVGTMFLIIALAFYLRG